MLINNNEDKFYYSMLGYPSEVLRSDYTSSIYLNTLPANFFVNSWANEAKKNNVNIPLSNNNKMEILFSDGDTVQNQNIIIRDNFDQEFSSSNVFNNGLPNSSPLMSIGGLPEKDAEAYLYGLQIDAVEGREFTVGFGQSGRSTSKSIFASNDSIAIALDWGEGLQSGIQSVKINPETKETSFFVSDVTSSNTFSVFFNNDESENNLITVDNLFLQQTDTVRTKLFNNNRSFSITNKGTQKSYNIVFHNLDDTLNCLNVKFKTNQRHIYTLGNWKDLHSKNNYIRIEYDDNDDGIIDSTIIGVKEEIDFLSSKFDIIKILPNPATDKVQLEYYLKDNSTVEMCIYSSLGKKLYSVNEGMQNFGYHSILINTSELNSGMYSLVLKTNQTVFSKPFIIKR